VKKNKNINCVTNNSKLSQFGGVMTGLIAVPVKSN
jgi:hypothetical protein